MLTLSNLTTYDPSTRVSLRSYHPLVRYFFDCKHSAVSKPIRGPIPSDYNITLLGECDQFIESINPEDRKVISACLVAAACMRSQSSSVAKIARQHTEIYSGVSVNNSYLHVAIGVAVILTMLEDEVASSGCLVTSATTFRCTIEKYIKGVATICPSDTNIQVMLKLTWAALLSNFRNSPGIVDTTKAYIEDLRGIYADIT